MKLATALLQRADLQKRLAEINNRMKNNAKVQEGEQPSEKPSELLKELDALLLQLEDLVTRINLTNSKTVLEDGRSITALIAHRDMLGKNEDVIK